MTMTMPDDNDSDKRSYGSDTMLTMRRRKPKNCINKREYICPYIESEEEVP